MKKLLIGGLLAALAVTPCLPLSILWTDVDGIAAHLRKSAENGEMTREEAILELEALARKYRRLAEEGPANVKDEEGRDKRGLDSDRCRSLLRGLGEEFGDKTLLLPFFEEMTQSTNEGIRSSAMYGYIRVSGAVGFLPFIERMEKDSRYTTRDIYRAYSDLVVFTLDPSPEDLEDGMYTPPPKLSDAEKAKVHAFMLKKTQTVDGSIVEILDEVLAEQLSDYRTSVQRAEFAERLANPNSEYKRKYWIDAKEEIGKVPAKKRKDFRAKGELLDPARKEK